MTNSRKVGHTIYKQFKNPQNLSGEGGVSNGQWSQSVGSSRLQG